MVDPGGYCPLMARLNRGTVGRTLQGTIRFAVYATREQIGVESWLACHSEHCAGDRIDSDDRSVFVTKRSLCGALQPGINGKKQVLARERIVTLENAQDAPLGVGFDTLIPDLAVQPFFIRGLDPGLSNVSRPSIFGLIDTVEFPLVDTPDIAERHEPAQIQEDSSGSVLRRRPLLGSGAG